MKLLLATTNLHKILELKALLKASFPSLDIYSVRDFKDYVHPEEIYDTFKGNAELKALEAAKHFDMLALSEDSGLVVPSLNGEPGVKSARYAGEDATDKDNIEKLLENMKDFPGDKRNAHYHVTMTLAKPDGVVKSVDGMCEGYIIEKPRGGNGFGYDSVFIKHGYNNTFAEIPDVKCRVSHRKKAFDKLLNTLEEAINCNS